MRSRWAFVALILAGVMCCSPAAIAEDPPAPAPVDDTAAQARIASLRAEASKLWMEGQHGPAEETVLKLAQAMQAPGARIDRAGVEALDGWGDQLRDAHRYPAAEQVFRSVLRLTETQAQPSPTDVAEALNRLGHILWLQARYEEARTHFRRELTLREQIHGPDDLQVTRALRNLAAQHAALEEYAEARTLYERALDVDERAFGAHDPRVADALNGLAMTILMAGDPTAARPLLERALAIRERSLPADHPEIALAAMNLGGLLEDLKQHELALPLFKRAYAIFEKAHGPEHPEVAYAALNLGALLRDAGQLQEARPLLEQAHGILARVLGEAHPDTVSAATTLSGLLDLQGEYARTRSLQEGVVGALERRAKPEDLRLANALHALGVAAQHASDPVEARRHLERALLLYERLKGPESAWLAPCLHNLALNFHQEGALDQARPLYERALVILEKVYGPSHPEVASCLGNLAMLHKSLGDSALAIRLLERALTIDETATERVPGVTIASTLNSLAWLYLERDEHDKARSHFERALAVYREHLGADHPTVGNSTHNLGFLHAAMGDDKRAEELYRAAIAIQELALAPGHADLLASRSNLAAVLGRTGRLAEAAEIYRDVVYQRTSQLRRSLPGFEGVSRLDMARNNRWILEQWLDLAPRVGASGYEELLPAKGLVARAEGAERRLALEGDADARAKHQQLVMATRRLAALSSAAPRPAEVEGRRAWQVEFSRASEDCERLSLELQRAVAPYREALARLDVRVEHVQASLGPDEALVDLLRTSGGYLAWIVRREGPVRRVDLGSASEIDAAAELFLEATTSGDAAAAQAGARLAALVVAPLQTSWGSGLRKLYIAPDAALSSVPFAALPTGEPGRVLGDTLAITHVTMAQDCVPSTRVETRGTGALLVGAADYERAKTLGTEAPRLARTPRGPRFRPLPETDRELESVASRVGKPYVMLRGEEATESRLRAQAPGHRVVHLATHGLIRKAPEHALRPVKDDPERWLGAGQERRLTGWDPRLLPVLAFAGANQHDGGDGDDGLLSALEASHLDLRGVDLVVLSACSSARGRTESGEGVVGLVQAFHTAGARHVVASLWPVDDLATRLLMEQFYERLLRAQDPQPAADALREASLWLRSWRDAGGRQPYAAPRHWAAFVVYGR